MVQVAALDPHAEGALRVIEYYDALVEHAATLEACVRASASLSGCIAGLRDDESAWAARYNEAGVAVEGESAPSMVQAVRVETREVGSVWLERAGDSEELDELVLERFARAAGALWKRSPRASRSIGSLVQSVLSSDISPDALERELRRLRFDPSRPIDVAAVVTDDVAGLAEQVTLVRDVIAPSPPDGAHVVWAAVGNVGVILGQSFSVTAGSDLPPTCRSRIGLSLASPAQLIAESWRRANAAARFGRILGFGPIVNHEDLGALVLLGEVAPRSVAANEDCRRLRELAEGPRGQEALESLDAFLVHDSVRQAASAMFVHHSTLHYRISQIEKTLGFGLEDQQGRVRASLALTLWRIQAR